MAPRRTGTSPNTLSPLDPTTFGTASSLSPVPGSPSTPRSPSPSTGLTQFLSKPSRWFTRSASASKAIPATSEPRSSTSSARKHKISRPTDPRPILDGYAAGASRSVLELSHRGPEATERHPPSTPSSPTATTLGDLRNISRKGWSRSADDLNKITTSRHPPSNPSFHDKVMQYRGRSGSSASAAMPSSPTSPTTVVSGRHPFPSIQAPNPPPSPLVSSPTRSATLPMLSISVSAPIAEEVSPSKSANPPLVHTRSHSFTPKLAKLATPRFLPPSPKTKGSTSSEREMEMKEGSERQYAIQISPPSPGTPSRAAFPFGLSGKSAPDHGTGGNGHTHTGHTLSGNGLGSNVGNHRTTTAPSLLAPPTIIEPGQEEDQNEGSTDPKRSSQIVYQGGFINRLADSSSSNLLHVNLSSSKSWKPFKMELKGSKLYFYKPPNDRATAIKELFPTGFVPSSLAEEDELEGESVAGTDDPESLRGRRGDMAIIGRKKRAFWGRRTHPELIRDGTTIEKGTFEALVHEAVFATTFAASEVKTQHGYHQQQIGDRIQEWRDFASSIILCLPSFVGRAKFETEFLRCCSYLVSGADDGAEEDEKISVTWLAMEYLRYHDAPVDSAAWEEWRQETIPDVSLTTVEQPNAQAGMPTSSSTQALYVPSPMIGAGSPNFNTFSPRPEDGTRLVSLVQALGGFGGSMSPTIPPTVSPRMGSVDLRMLEQQHYRQQSLHPQVPMSRVPWSALDKEGLSRDVLLAIDPHILSQSLTLYHRTVLENIPDNITAASIFTSNVSESMEQHDMEYDMHSLRPLFGTDEQPHWLTKLLLLQILGNDTSTGQVAAATSHPSSPGRKSDDRTAQTSRTHSRSEVISVWARVGELCRIAGDECSWRAILAALCSRPVARLDKVWKRVDPQALAAIESWVHANEEGEISDVGEPRSTPWGGDVRVRVKEELDKVQGEHGGEEVFKVESLNQARIVFERFRTSFVLCPRKTYVIDGELDVDVKRMVSYWQQMALEGGGMGGLSAKFQRVEQFMSLSLAAEPKRKGLFEPYYWSRPLPSQAPSHSLLPLLFPEPLPTVHFLDRTQLLRGRVDSDTSDVLLRGIQEERRNGAQPQRYRDQLSQGGTIIPVYNGELLLVVQKGVSVDSAPNSRPSSHAASRPPSSVYDSIHEKSVSRAPSIRVKPGSSQGLDRKASMAKRSSLPSLSQRPNFVISEPSSTPPLRVAVQAGTLNTLVKTLVQGLHGVSVSVADDNGEMSLREGISRELVLDRNEFVKVWWNVFRSFVAPLVFFELLRKLYITSQPTGAIPTINDYLHAANSRGQVLGTIREWLATGGGAQDVLDDAQLFNAIRDFLDSSMDHAVHESPHFSDLIVQQAWQGLTETRQSLGAFFISQTMRPRLIRMPQLHHMKGAAVLRTKNLGGREPPDIDRIDPEEFVDNLDGMASAAFSNVIEEDLYIMADLLEIQTADRTGWFSLRDAGSVEENVEIQSMYTHLQEVEPSSLIPELGHEVLYRMLPPSIRSCIRAYGIIRKWLISKIIAPRLGIRGRQTRLEFLLQVIEVARLRNMERPDASQLAMQPCIRSFVEAVVSSALTSTESRTHQRAWQNVAFTRGVTCDALTTLLSRPYKDMTHNHDSLTVDMGWLIERMLEVIVTPDVIDSTVNENQGLVNFDKRRQLHNLINQAPSIPATKRHGHSDEVNRRGFERLNNIEKEVMHLQFDPRGIKEESMREALHASTSGSQSGKKVARPFHRLLTYQMEKNRRDKNVRTRLQKEKLHEQARYEKREDILSKAMKSKKPQSAAQKQHRNKKSMSAFLSFMRPLSSAFGADISASPAHKRTPSELDFKATGKPILVLSLMDAHVAQFVNNERSYTFKLDTEDGGHYLLQAMNKRDLTKWLETIGRIAKMATKRRLTYIGNSPKPVLSDHLHVEPATASRDPFAVFGVELDFLLARESGGGSVQPGTVPRIIEQCLSEVETRGLSEVGIYRIAGATSEINALKDAYNRGESPIHHNTDIHAVCDLVKSWFRVLPEPVFPSSSYYEIIQKMQLDNLEERLAGIRSVVQRLPQPNFDLLRRVSEHLDQVTDYEEHNQMTAEALSIVFSPNLLRAPQNDFVMILANMGHTHKLVKALITHYHVIFDEADPEAEAHSEDEYDPPIPEEDEEEEEEEVGETRSQASDEDSNERITSEHDS
ncbi:hypothetical protein AX17_001617 [Amanita inopinata Kibby_2008]|nr:hypothetical protein AX17_001617 [Amanita inopinata Kibby_2008]